MAFETAQSLLVVTRAVLAAVSTELISVGVLATPAAPAPTIQISGIASLEAFGALTLNGGLAPASGGGASIGESAIGQMEIG